MKTIDQILKYKSEAIDGRDIIRLAEYIPEHLLEKLGVKLEDEFVGKHKAKDLTRENILENLKSDLAFAFEKALGMRGISASCMYYVIRMWNWVLEEGLEDYDKYAQYGLPTLKATAIKYGFENPIGDDLGSESKYKSY